MADIPANSIFPRDRQELRQWFLAHHEQQEGMWVVTYKRSSGRAVVTYDDIVEECLCFGWIDSRGGAVDDERTMLYIAPRRRRSAWAGTNKRRVEQLTATGLMTPAGLITIERAKADGSWTALDEVEALVVPSDLSSALQGTDLAESHFHGFPPSAKRMMLQWVAEAKRPETRANRIGEIARKAASGIRAKG